MRKELNLCRNMQKNSNFRTEIHKKSTHTLLQPRFNHFSSIDFILKE